MRERERERVREGGRGPRGRSYLPGGERQRKRTKFCTVHCRAMRRESKGAPPPPPAAAEQAPLSFRAAPAGRAVLSDTDTCQTRTRTLTTLTSDTDAEISLSAKPSDATDVSLTRFYQHQDQSPAGRVAFAAQPATMPVHGDGPSRCRPGLKVRAGPPPGASRRIPQALSEGRGGGGRPPSPSESSLSPALLPARWLAEATCH